MINARVETLAEKPTFRGALRHRRCVFLADGFYEWRRRAGQGGHEVPVHDPPADRAPMALAACGRTGSARTARRWTTAAIVTTNANGVMAAVHDRCRRSCRRSRSNPGWIRAAWSGRGGTPLPPLPEDWLTLDPVSPRVNNVRIDAPDLIEPLDTPRPGAPETDRPPAERPRSSDEDAQGALF